VKIEPKIFDDFRNVLKNRRDLESFKMLEKYHTPPSSSRMKGLPSLFGKPGTI
jgi:hypothetical protein